MFRRCVLALALVAPTGTIGCGLMQAELQQANSLRPGAETRSFDRWSTEVVMTAMEVSGVEFRMIEGEDHDFRIGVAAAALGATPGTKLDMARGVEVKPQDLYLESGSFGGKTADGRAVTVWVRGHDEGKKTDLTVLIGRHGDRELSRAYLDRVADRLDHPIARTPAEAAGRKLKVPLEKRQSPPGESIELDTAEPQPAAGHPKGGEGVE